MDPPWPQLRKTHLPHSEAQRRKTRTGTTTVSSLRMILSLLGRVLSGARSRGRLMIMAPRNLLLHAGSLRWTSVLCRLRSSSQRCLTNNQPPDCSSLVPGAVEYSPFYGIEKGAVLQEARMFNDRNIDARRCQQVCRSPIFARKISLSSAHEVDSHDGAGSLVMRCSASAFSSFEIV